MAPLFLESAQQPLNTSGFDFIFEGTCGDTEVMHKHRETRPSLEKMPPLLRDSVNPSTNQSSIESSAHLWRNTLALGSSPSKKGPDSATLLNSQDLSWSSSTVKTWNKLSPAPSVGMWDLPETPPRLSDTPSPDQAWTPATPPTPYSPSLGRRPAARIFVKELGNSYLDEEIGISDVNSASQAKDGFQPKKLFRNCTLQLDKISKANAAAGNIKYSKEPSLNFSPDEPQPISSRTRSKTSKDVKLPNPENLAQTDEAPTAVVTQLVSDSKLPSFLELILPLDLYQRLRDVFGRCIASVPSRSYEQCIKGSSASLEDALILAKEFARCKSKKDYSTIIRKIEELVRQAMCSVHQNVVLKEIKEGARIRKLREYLCSSQNMSETDQQALHQWLGVISNPNALTDHIPWIRRGLVPTTSFADFTPFQLKRTKGVPVSDALLMEIQRPLGASEIDPGFIYMFWDKQYFGKLKIGRTIDIKARLKQWNKQCGKTHSYLSQDDRSCVEMPHVGRAEALIHTELKECREKRKCQGCGKLHQEWFGESEVHAIKVVRKWQEWMMQQPYVKNETGQWVLRPEMVESLGRVCEPLARDNVVVKQVRKSEGAKRSLRKRGGRKTI